MSVASSGICNYDDIHDIVEALVRIKARRYAVGYMTAEDIAQEIRLKCFLLLPKFNANRVTKTPMQFFNTCTDNDLRNKRRDLYDIQTPCSPHRCEYFDKNAQWGEHCMVNQFQDRSCTRLCQYLAHDHTKKTIMVPEAFDDPGREGAPVLSSDDIDMVDIYDYLNSHLSDKQSEVMYHVLIGSGCLHPDHVVRATKSLIKKALQGFNYEDE
jgi:DNA-directed RNA polymerase specialized sigma24 family protein